MAANQAIKQDWPARQGPAVPAGVVGSLAVHSRASGVCLLLFGPDSAVVYHDAAAGPFFERYVVPALGRADATADPIRHCIKSLTAQSPVQVWRHVPGAAICALPYFDRRQLQGALALTCKTHDFRLDEDVLRLCSQLGLDATWLETESKTLPSPPIEHLAASVALFLDMLADRLRVGSLEQELNSLSTQLANAYEELTLIDQINSGMRVNRRSSDFFRQACFDVMPVINVRAMGVALRNDELHEEPALYGEISLPPGCVQQLADQLLVTLDQRKSCFIINSLANDQAYHWLSSHAARLIAVPLLRREQLLGCLFALDKHSGDFDSVDSKLLAAIANESAIYLENAMLFGDVHDLMMGLLHSLTSAVDAKDAYTCGHSERVALLSRHLAAKADVADAEVERIYMAGLLHDVGKIGIPESVLQKTGRLTPEEFDVMKRHCQIGARILGDVKQLEDVVPGVLHHHERYDGRGYPMGFAGHDIPLMGRIICLADCFDAMTSNRTYRKALPLEVALTEIHRCSATQFDPALAEVFLSISVDQLRLLLRDHRDQAKKLIEFHQEVCAS